MYSRGIAFFILLSTTVFGSDLSSLSDAIKVARAQNVLTQRALSQFCMVGMNLHYKNPKKGLEASIKTFESNLDGLDNFATSKEAFKNIEEIQKAWAPIKSSLAGAKTKEMGLALREKVTSLLSLTRATTNIYTKQTGSSLGKILDASVDLGIYAQSLATLHLLQSWDKGSPEIAEKIQDTVSAFNKALSTAKKAKINTQETTALLDKIGKAFMYFTIMDAHQSSHIPALIYKKADSIIKDSNTLFDLYNKIITL